MINIVIKRFSTQINEIYKYHVLMIRRTNSKVTISELGCPVKRMEFTYIIGKLPLVLAYLEGNCSVSTYLLCTLHFILIIDQNYLTM